ncbi:M42 family metallopeptidase [Clostridium luticellarii]|uniref:Putative aminopeptidase YsdC n=1 Tax=Clostridium luticellarii TaxID=1691940 RepID=A0A2T0B6M5_9CLOT|nr:M42 family peptidase [Clostridium luticellarii]MCI1969599.1 M42 family peptidase [Clostridium luticellarii]MCI1996817.1 M42 family peptidase [Clostridium luticellarii]MCI2041081.1 M42 family peptidase [Clostridium luticellarii]PRR79536.1 putative aminopeptidase YsdC [Clostridium luticellarii]
MFLEKLCNSVGPSGYEDETRKVILNELGMFTKDIDVDRMGNVVVHRNNSSDSARVMVVSHMDELGLIITGYNEDGTLKFSTIGNVDKNSLPCKTILIGNKKISGIIGIKPIHLQNKKEVNESLPCENMCIDIGALNREECRKIVSLGDFAVFDNYFCCFGDDFIEGKALDSRIGCSILMELLKQDFKCNLYGVFSVQGNMGQRGVYGAAYNINPDMTIILDGINSTDVLESPGHLKTIQLGSGPLIPFKAGESIFDKNMVEAVRNEAVNMNIPYQKVGDTKGEGELKAIGLTVDNCKTAVILMPCRYKNFSVSLCSKIDYQNTLNLLKNYLREL